MGRWPSRITGAVFAAALATGCSQVDQEPRTAEQQLPEATVTVAGRCAGVIIAGGRQLLTAAHCLRPRERRVQVTFINGEEQQARLASIDRRRDLAVLSLSGLAPFDGLEVTEALPLPGTAAYFAGRHDRGGRLQPIHIVRLGPCPSLPHVPAALFTSLRGLPGDSGAPVVDASTMKVVGLVHGGARCSVAAPAYPALAMLQLADDALVAARTPPASASDVRPPSALGGAMAPGQRATAPGVPQARRFHPLRPERRGESR